MTPLEVLVLLLHPLPRTASRLQSVVMLALPHGGQAVARRNAWAGMSADAARGRERRQAESALAAADVRAYATAPRTGTRPAEPHLHLTGA